MRLQHRSTRSALAVAAAAALAACAGFGTFVFTEESDEIEVEGDPITGGLQELFPVEIPMTVQLEERLEEQNASGARSVHLTEIEFRMEEDSDQEHFGFLSSIDIDVDADGQSREILAWQDDIPAESSFTLEVNDELDLKPYVEAGMDLFTEVEGSAPARDARFRVYATFEVDVL